jgi:hypothetical protein
MQALYDQSAQAMRNLMTPPGPSKVARLLGCVAPDDENDPIKFAHVRQELGIDLMRQTEAPAGHGTRAPASGRSDNGDYDAAPPPLGLGWWSRRRTLALNAFFTSLSVCSRSNQSGSK